MRIGMDFYAEQCMQEDAFERVVMQLDTGSGKTPIEAALSAWAPY